MTITEVEKNHIKDFFVACNEMIDGRFILSDIKIARILKSIANSEVLYDLFAKCLINFNFKAEFKKAIVSNQVNGGYFVLPTDEKQIVALVFCFLLEVDKGKMNLQTFVNDNFYSPDGYNISYSNFSINVLVPFKNSVMNLLNVDENGELQDGESEAQQLPEQQPLPNVDNTDRKLLFANLMRALNQLYTAVLKEGRLHSDERQEVVIVIKALNEAIKLENLKIINALVIPLEYQIGKIKSLKVYYDDFKECLVSFYYK